MSITNVRSISAGVGYVAPKYTVPPPYVILGTLRPADAITIVGSVKVGDSISLIKMSILA